MTSSCFEARRKSWKPGWNTRQANPFNERHDYNTRTPGKIQVVPNTRHASSNKHQRVVGQCTMRYMKKNEHTWHVSKGSSLLFIFTVFEVRRIRVTDCIWLLLSYCREAAARDRPKYASKSFPSGPKPGPRVISSFRTFFQQEKVLHSEGQKKV